MEVNYEFLYQLGYGTKEEICSAPDAFACDPDYGSHPMIIRAGMWLRLSRNLDKDRGFCNGALGKVIEVFQYSNGPVFVMRLTHGVLVLVHPIKDDSGKLFLPCTYGYAMTTRKAQGATLDYAVLYFDQHHFPAQRGYAYVGASRVKVADHLFYFGCVRRSDWLPVGGDPSTEQVDRSVESCSDDEASGRSDDESNMDLGDGEQDADGEQDEDDGFLDLGEHVCDTVEGIDVAALFS